MNNQKKQTNGKHADGLSKRRLFLKKAGVAAPVLLTLTSPSVFGLSDLCLSQQLSGVHSGTTASCNTGVDPIAAKAKWLSSDGSRSFNTELGASLSSDLTFSTILTAYAGDSSHKDEAYFVTAWLNAYHGVGDSGDPYTLTVLQVKLLYGGSPVPAPYADVYTFLEATWRTA
ncbi:MAG: hypothetical protein PHU14_01730 [Methylovulum sp.]|nr:hypothetical protein [Methylovulum sp.]